ncbi:MAG TPA: DUF4258 domain-containing protein [Phycisphaerae bacterium]|nr:DUF4258 domain-containing protein [Phycisphaerae bacterium]
MKEIRYFIDSETGQPHIYGHNVDESEVEEVLLRPLKQQPSRDNSKIALGQTGSGRFLKVIYTEDEDRAGLFVVTAYDLRGKALKALRRRLRK